MPILFCPNCKERVTIADVPGDVVHTCNSGKLARDQEDVFDRTQANYSFAGVTNREQGRRAGTGYRFKPAMTPRHANADVVRTRQHYHYIEVG